MWLKLMPEVAVFSFAQTSEESVVSLFLELLLAEVNWDVLFKNSQTEDLIFQDSQENRLEFTYVLILFFSLLSRSQRRQVGIGSRGAPFTDTGINFLERFSDRADEGSATNIYRAWPKQISLFARHWITTVPDLMPRYDIRKAIDIHPLPKGSVIFEKSYWSKLKCRNKEPLDKQILENYGPTVAGTWYLGILKGGNTDLGTDVMKVILSEEYEKQRLFNRCGAPVSAALYNKDFIGPKAERDNNNGTVKICKKPNTSNHELPYADVMQAVYCDFSSKSNTKQEKSYTSTNPKNEEQKTIHFPFHRSQIKDYLEISAILYDLVRHVMRLEIQEEGALDSDHLENLKFLKSGGSPENSHQNLEHIKHLEWLFSDIKSLVDLAFDRMKKTWEG